MRGGADSDDSADPSAARIQQPFPCATFKPDVQHSPASVLAPSMLWSPTGQTFARLWNRMRTSQYTPCSQTAECVQDFPDRVDNCITTNWTVDVTVKSLRRQPDFFLASSGARASLEQLPNIPQALRCHRDISPKQIIQWPVRPVPVILSYPRSRHIYRASSKDEISDLILSAADTQSRIKCSICSEENCGSKIAYRRPHALVLIRVVYSKNALFPTMVSFEL